MRASHHVKQGIPLALDHNKSERKFAQENSKNAQKLHRTKKLVPRTSAAHWSPRVKKPADSALYGIQIAYRGRRHRFPLETANKDAAGEKARNIYLSLVSEGWEATLERFKPKTVKRKQLATVGQLIETTTRLSSARSSSLDVYAQALRRIASGALAIKNRGKQSRQKNAEWLSKVNAVPLENLTPPVVLAWKNIFLKAAKTPSDRNSAVVTFNSLLRNSKALVSKKLMPFIEQELMLPSPLWFEGVSKEKEPSLRYHSKINASDILRAAQDELANEQPEIFKALLLTLYFGLRRSEADALLWRQFDFDKQILQIADTEHKALKSKDSAGVIGLDPQVVAVLKRYRSAATGEFVLEEPKRRGGVPNRRYRCNMHFRILIEWLKSKKVPGIRPIHTLRKEVGSVIATRDGIFAASRFLRHSTIGITAKLYADAKKPISSGLGGFLAPSPETVIQAVVERSIANEPLEGAQA